MTQIPVLTTQWSSVRAEDRFFVHNPINDKPITIVQGSGAAETDACVKASHEAFQNWRWVSPHDRGKLLKQAAQVVKGHFDEIAELETTEEGKPLFISRGDTQRCVDAFEYFGGLIGNLPSDTFDLGPAYAHVMYEPFGVVAGIIPFNWPPLHTAAKTAPALAMGNTIILKPGDQAPLAIMRIVELLQDVFPKNVLQVITGPGAEVGKILTTHPLVRKISFTGSSSSGKAVLHQAAENFTSCMMELGGKNAFLIMKGCDVDELIPTAYEGAFYNNGQACTATSRIIVHRSLHDEFVEKFSDIVRRIRVGDGMNPRTQVGPLVTRDQQRRVLDYLKIGVGESATIAAQAAVPTDPQLADGYFVPPTLFTGVKHNMRIAQEEIFGPVTGVIAFDDPEEGVAIANNTAYGLVGVVYSPDYIEGLRIARQLDVGCVYVNNFYRFGFECVPFGGSKASGYGRERSLETLREFAQMKTIKTLSGLGEIPGWSFDE